MTRARRTVVTLLLAGLIGMHLFELARDSEHWPFCSYPMYSWLEDDDPAVEGQRLMGLRADNGEEIWLHGRQYVDPFDPSRLHEASLHITEAADAKTRWDRALGDLLRRYEERRQASLHDGPKLKGMRIYQTRHDLHPEAANLATPTRRQLLAEAEYRPTTETD
jgi:hypothetical protein